MTTVGVRLRVTGLAAASLLVLAQCGAVRQPDDGPAYVEPPPRDGPAAPKGAAISDTPAIPESAQPGNVYAATTTGLAPSVADIAPRVYVPNEKSGSVSVIDPATLTVIGKIKVGTYPQHITPSLDLSRLYVNDSALTEIDARTGKVLRSIGVPLPYNLYFTLDGTKAIVVAEDLNRLDFYDPQSWKLIKSVPIPWSGIDHLDMSADGSYLLATCEFSGRVVKVDTNAMALVGNLDVGGLPIDVKLAPDGSVFYITNQGRNGVSIVDPVAMKEVGFLQHLDEQPHDDARRVELPAALALRRSEAPEEVLIYAPQDVSRAALCTAETDGAHEVDEFAEAGLVERRSGVVLREDALEPGVRLFDAFHRVVDGLADRRLLRFGLELGPARFRGHPEHVVRKVLIAILRVGVRVLRERGTLLFERV